MRNESVPSRLVGSIGQVKSVYVASWPILIAIGMYITLTVIGMIGARLINLEHGAIAAGTLYEAMGWPGVWARWDSGFYLAISERGYSAANSTPLYYPLYPLFVRILSAVVGVNVVASGTLLSLIFSSASFWLLYRVIVHDYGTRIGRLCVILIAVFPTSFFLFSIYTEAMFLFLSVLAYFFARNRMWLYATVVCLVAGFGRYNGFLISLLVAVEFLYQHSFRRTYVLRSALLLLPGFLGFLCFQLYLWIAFGDPLLSFRIQRDIGERFITWPWISILDTIELAATGKDIDGNWFWRVVAWQELAFTTLFVFLAALGLKTLRPSLAVYLVVSLAMYIMSHGPDKMGLMSMPRYVLPLFPAFLVMAISVQFYRWKWLVVVLMGTMLLAYTLWFGSGRWVA